MKVFLNNTLIIDGSYMLMRAMTQPDLSELRTCGGKPSGGFFGFLRMMNSVIRKYPGYYPIVCWDKGRAPRRLELYPNYKHNADRISNPVIPGSPDDEFLSALREQRGSVIEYLESIRVPCIRIPDWEGDDLVYLLSKASKKSVVVTDDRDMIQLCSPTCKVDRVMNHVVIDYQTCEYFYRYPQYEYYKAIIGDGSDNIPHCCEGIGGKSAEKIASVMAEFVKESECDPHDYSLIFNYLKTEPSLQDEWAKVRGLRKKINDFIESYDKFVFNMKLMDFTYVEEPENMQALIESSVIPTIKRKASIMEAFKILGKYEVNEIDPGDTMSRLIGSSSVLFVEDIGG